MSEKKEAPIYNFLSGGGPDLRTSFKNLIANKSNSYRVEMIFILILMFISLFSLFYVLFDMAVNPNENFWNQEHKGVYYNRAILGTGLVSALISFVWNFILTVQFYKLLRQEDNFITDIAVLGDITNIKKEAQPSLRQMIVNRIGKKNTEGLNIIDPAKDVTGVGSAGLLASNTLQQSQTVPQTIRSNIPYFGEINDLSNKYRDELYTPLLNAVQNINDGGIITIREKGNFAVKAFIESIIARRIALNPPFEDWCARDKLCNDKEGFMRELTGDTILKALIGGGFSTKGMNTRNKIIIILDSLEDWNEIESLPESELKQFFLAFKP